MLERYAFAHLHGWMDGTRRGYENLFCLSMLFYENVMHYLYQTKSSRKQIYFKA